MHISVESINHAMVFMARSQWDVLVIMVAQLRNAIRQVTCAMNLLEDFGSESLGGRPLVIMKLALVSSLPGDAKFYFWHVAVALGLFMLLIVIIDALNLDQKLSLLFYDPVSASFPLRDDWLL